ncbi:ATP-binding protein [Paenibacillus hodogayensis]|uniref:histidine kinase n=1 Tax=Paenibacillus hodogayensis TaxID=279208 RepID=A0ABV5VRY3_9BACL
MLVYFVALLTAAFVLFLLHRKRMANRWAAFFLLFASVGGLVGFMRGTALPLLAERPDAAGWLGPLNAAAQVLEAVNHTLTPYGVLVFCAVYAGRFSSTRLTRLKLALLVPVALSAAVYAAVGASRSFFLILLLWAVPYYAASCWLLIAGWLRETNRWRKKERLAVAVLSVPTLAAIAGFINVGSLWQPGYYFFDYVAVFIAYSLLAGVAFAFGSGVLGVRVRLERDPLDSAVSAVSSGTAMLNHTIKNEIAKISMCADNVKFALGPEHPDASEQLGLIEKSAEHMRRMVERMHGQTREIVLREEPLRLAERIGEQLAGMSPWLTERRIAVERLTECDPIVRVDPVHVGEVVTNIVHNAAEAMPEGGTLYVRIAEAKRGIAVSFRDTGSGIAKDRLERVLEPFYTTKASRGGGNFGLGLTYAYQVMRQSGGSIELNSVEGEGTTVRLLFPTGKRK